MKMFFIKNKKWLSSRQCLTATRYKSFFVVLLMYACLPSCNRGGFGGGGDTVTPAAQVDISTKMVSRSTATTLGKGQIVVYASYSLTLSCLNCSLLGLSLPFSEGVLDGRRYVHVAEFDYSLPTHTEECAIEITAVSKGSTKVNARKKYNIYACPISGTAQECDTTNAVPSCAHIGR